MADIAMTLPRPPRRLDLSDRRVGIAVLIGSVVLHGALFLALAMRGADLPGRTAAPTMDWPVSIRLEPTPNIRNGSRPTAARRTAPASTPASAAAPPVLAVPSSSRPVVPPDATRPVEVPITEPTPEAALDARVARALRRGVAGCRMMAGRLNPVDQAECDRASAQAAATAVPIIGTGKPERDARLAAEGAQALADYERRRAPLKPNSRAQPCPHGTDMMGECPVRVMVPIWSSIDGFLPGLKRDD